jgi:hypothetical protein
MQVHGVDERGKTVVKKQLRRNPVLPFFANACGTLSTVWSRAAKTIYETTALRLPRSFVEPASDGVELALANIRWIHAFGEVVAQQTIGVAQLLRHWRRTSAATMCSSAAFLPLNRI